MFLQVKNLGLFNLLVIAYIFLVVVAQVVPFGGLSVNTFHFGPFRSDYLLHLIVFLPWMFFLYIKPGSGWRPEIKTIEIRAFIGWAALGLVLAVGSESIQLLVDHRSFNPMDMIFNALGVVAGAVLIPGSRCVAGLSRCALRRPSS